MFGIGKGLRLIHVLSLQKSDMNCTIPSFFNIMKVGAAHLLALIHFNTPSLMSHSNSTRLKNVLPLVQNDNYSEPKLVCRQLFSNVYEDIESVYTFFQFLLQQISK